MDTITEYWNQSIGFLGPLSTYLFIAGLAVVREFNQWKFALWSTLLFGGTVFLGNQMAHLDVFHLPIERSYLVVSIVGLMISALGIFKRSAGQINILGYIFVAAVGLAIGLKQSWYAGLLTSSPTFSETLSGLVIALLSFLFSYFLFLAVKTLLVSAFTLAKREISLVVCGAIFGISLVSILAAW